MERTTFKDIINDIQLFVDAYPQIEEMIYSEFETYGEDFNYPALFVYPDVIQNEGNISEVTLNVWVGGLLEHDRTNELDITNNLTILTQDFLAYFWDNVEDNGTMDIVTNKTDDNLIGVNLSVTFDIKSYACFTPMNPYHEELMCSSSATTIGCYGGTSTVTVWGEGGTPPYVGTGDFEVSAGTHNYIIFDADGFQANTSIEVNQPNELIATATALEVDERIREPFLSEVEITATGGTAPYTMDSHLIYECNADSEINVYNSSPSEAIITREGDAHIVDIVTTNGNYPIILYDYDNTMINGNDYVFSFDYEVLSGHSNGILFRTAADFTTGGYWIKNTGNLSGSFMKKFTMNILGKTRFGIQWHYGMITGTHLVIKISNMKLYSITETVERELPTTELETFGSGYTYNITDGNGCTATTNEVSLEVPTPDGTLRIGVIDGSTNEATYAGYDARLRVHANTNHPMYDGNIYVNWGDGEIETIPQTSTAYIYLNHNYSSEYHDKMLPIDIYGHVGYWRFIEGSKPSVEKEWFAKPGTFYNRSDVNNPTFVSRLYCYHGNINAPINELKTQYGNNIGWQYYYYTQIPYGDIGKMKDTEYLYSINYRIIPNTSSASWRTSEYGDIGTYLKGNYREDAGVYYKYIAIYQGSFTYTDRLDAPIMSLGSGQYMVYCRGYNTTTTYQSIRSANQVAQLIVDLDTWWVNPSGGIIALTNNASPNDADEPLLSEFIAAKANLIANGVNISHS